METIDAATFSAVLAEALGAGDYADAFYERRVARSFRLQDGAIHEAGLTLVAGVGIRVLSGERAGYAHTDDLSREALVRTARIASAIARGGSARTACVKLGGRPQPAPPEIYRAAASLDGTASAAYVDLLARADIAARAYDPKIVTVNASIAEELQEVVIATSEGRFVTDRRPLVTLAVQCVARGAVRGNGFSADGGRTNLEYFREQRRSRRPQATCRSSWAPAAAAFSCTKRSATVSKGISIGKAPRSTAGASASVSRANSSRSTTTATCRTSAAASRW